MTEEQIITIATNMANNYFAGKTMTSSEEFAMEYLNYLDYAIKNQENMCIFIIKNIKKKVK